MAQEKVAISVEVQNEQAITSVKEMRTAIKSANSELIRAQSLYGEFSQEAVQAAKRVAQLKDQMQAAGDLAARLNPDAKFKAFSATIQGLAGGFAGLQGAIGLVGTQSAEVEKQLLKVQSALALSQGLDSLLEARESFKALGAIIKGGVINAFRSLKVAIGSTGIGLIVVAIGLLVANFDKLKKALLDTFPALGNVKQLFNDLLQIARGVGNAIVQYVLTPFKALGKVLAGDFEGAFEEIKKGLNVVANFNKGVQDEITRQNENAAKERLANQIKADEKNLEVLQARGKSTIALERQILQNKLKLYKDDEEKYAETLQALRVLDAKAAKEKDDAAKAQAEKDKAAREKAEADRKAAREAAVEADKKIVQELETIGQSEREAELIALRQWFEEQKAIYDKAGLDIINLVTLYNAKRLELNDKYRAEDLAKVEEFFAKQNELMTSDAEQVQSRGIMKFQGMLDLVKGIVENTDLTLAQRQEALDKSNAEFKAKQAQFGIDAVQIEQAYTDANKQLAQERVNAKQAEFEAYSGLISAVSGLLGQQTAASKAAAIAATTIDTYAAASTIFKQASLNPTTIPFPAYPYIQSATAVVAGLARVRQILAVKTPAGGGGGGIALPSNAAAPITPTPNIGTTRLDAQTIDNLGNRALNNRAYVLESEITDQQARQRRIERAAKLGG